MIKKMTYTLRKHKVGLVSTVASLTILFGIPALQQSINAEETISSNNHSSQSENNTLKAENNTNTDTIEKENTRTNTLQNSTRRRRTRSIASRVTTLEQLKQAIANNDSEIIIDNDLVVTETIQIPSTFTGKISSNGVTLSLAPSVENMFNITNATVTFENIILDGANNGRLVNVTGGHARFSQVTFQNGTTQQFSKRIENGVNKQRYNGGAVHASGTILTFEDAIFKDNKVKSDVPLRENLSDIALSAHGGAIFAETSTLNITGGSFTNNIAGNTVDNAYGEGGAIKLENLSVLNINQNSSSRTVFDGNHVFKTVSNVAGAQGGSIEVTQSTAHIKNTDFIVKGGFDTGGAIKFEGAGSATTHNTISNTTFRLVGGQLPSGSAYFGTSGGAIMTENSYLSVDSSQFTMENFPAVTFAGGFVDVVGSGVFNLANSSLTGNGADWNMQWKQKSAKYGGAIAFENNASVTSHIQNTTFKNFSVDHTGAIISVGTKDEAKNTLGSTTVNLTIENSTLSNARAYTFDANSAGGGVFVSQGSTVVIKGGKIEQVMANYGGAIYNKGHVTLENKAIITNGSTTQMASGIFNDGYLNVHSANILYNQKTNDAAFSGGNHQFSNGEHSGGAIYAKKDIIVGSDATFSTNTNKQDVRVIHGQSSVILSGPRQSVVYVSVSETPNTATGYFGKDFAENAQRHIGYLVGKGLTSDDLSSRYVPSGISQSYTPTEEDAKKFHYVSNSVDSAQIAELDDHINIGKWDYVFNPENKTIVLGQRAKLIYHSNTGVFSGKNNDTINEQLVTVYKADQIGFEKNTTLNPTKDNFEFVDWYNENVANSVQNMPNADTEKDNKFDFATARVAGNGPIITILNPNLFNIYAGYTPIKKYIVTHEFKSGTLGKELPDEIKQRTPQNQVDKLDKDVVTPTDTFDKTEVVDTVNDGVWSFTSWDKITDTINKANVHFIGTWVFTPNKYIVTHEFKSGTPGKELPDEIKQRTPQNQVDKLDKDVVTPTDTFDKTEVVDTVNDGVWSFTSWDKTTDTINKANVHFIGTWVFTPNKYIVTHEFKSGTPGKELPDEIKQRTPQNQVDKLDKELVNPTDTFDKTSVIDTVNDGVWSFTQWDKSTDTINKANVHFIGTWVFTPNDKPKEESITTTTTITSSNQSLNKKVVKQHKLPKTGTQSTVLTTSIAILSLLSSVIFHKKRHKNNEVE